MKKLLIILCVLCSGACTILDRNYWEPNCGGYSIFQAQTMIRNGYQARIAITPTDDPKIYHAQAQAFVNGKWEWLASDPALVWIGEKESEYPVVEYVTIMESVNFQKYNSKVSW